MRSLVPILTLILLLSFFFNEGPYHSRAGASDAAMVHNVSTGLNYTSIQEAIDAPETVDGNTILVDPGSYFEHLVVSKSLAIKGEERNTTTIDGRGGGVIVTVAANNVLLSGLTVKNGSMGIFFDYSRSSVLVKSRVTDIAGINGSTDLSLYSI